MTDQTDGRFWFGAKFLGQMLRDGDIFRPRSRWRFPSETCLDELADQLNNYAMIFAMVETEARPRKGFADSAAQALQTAAEELAALQTHIASSRSGVRHPRIRASFQTNIDDISAMIETIARWQKSEALSQPNLPTEKSEAQTRHFHNIIRDAFCNAMRSENPDAENAFTEASARFVAKVLPLMTGGRMTATASSVAQSFKPSAARAARRRSGEYR